MKSYTARVLAVIAALSLIVNVLLYFRYSTSRPLVTVGDSVITKKQYLDQLEYESGQTVLKKLVMTALVDQTAARAGLMPTAQDVEDRIETIQRQAPQVLTPYSRDPSKMAQFREYLATTMALENLRIRDVALSPAQIAGYYERHAADFALPPQTVTTTVVTQNAVDSGTAAELLRLNDSPDVISRQPRLRVVGSDGYNPDLQTLPAAFRQQTSDWAGAAPLGAVKTFQAGAYSLTFRVDDRRPGVVPPLDQVRGEVERAARLEIAPSPEEEMARLYRNAPPVFSSDKYAAYCADVQQSPLGTGSRDKTAELP